MSVRFRPTIAAMHPYVPGEQPPAGTTLIKLNTNENPYPPSPTAAQAIRAELDAELDGETGAGSRLRLYSDPRATWLCEAAAEVTGVPSSRILAGNGSDELLGVLARAFAGPGDRIAYPYPTYLLYETMARIQGAEPLPIDAAFDFALPEELSATGAALTFVANPNAPSGTLHSLEELSRLAGSLEGVLVIDEAYAEFSGQSALPLLDHHDNLVVLRTLSKSHSLAGVRVGLLFAAEELVAGLHKVKDSYSLDRLAIVAGAASLRDQAWTAANVARIISTRERLTRELTRLGLAPLPSHANFVFVRMGSAARAESAYRHLRSRGVLVRYFAMRLLDDGLRITVGTDAEIDALLAALRDVVGS